MDLTENARRSHLPSFLDTSSSSRLLAIAKLLIPGCKPVPLAEADPEVPSGGGSFLIQAPNDPSRIEMYSPMFYAACTAGGIASCRLTHMAVTRLDLVKCYVIFFC
ncbi:putative mitochondrial phosphate carrier protein Pic2/Mir1 [Dioscorea sansibarensis]